MLSGCVTAILSILIWGTGGVKILSRRLTTLEDDVGLNQKRLEREVKQRASMSSPKVNSANLMAEMQTLAAARKDTVNSNSGEAFLG